jgi:hypothetical protein
MHSIELRGALTTPTRMLCTIIAGNQLESPMANSRIIRSFFAENYDHGEIIGLTILQTSQRYLGSISSSYRFASSTKDARTEA